MTGLITHRQDGSLRLAGMQKGREVSQLLFRSTGLRQSSTLSVDTKAHLSLNPTSII